MIGFLILPIAPKIIVAIGLANISAPAQFPFPVDFYVDSEEYFVYISTYIAIAVFFLITIIISVDTMFVVFVQHACGIFAAIG